MLDLPTALLLGGSMASAGVTLGAKLLSDPPGHAWQGSEPGLGWFLPYDQAIAPDLVTTTHGGFGVLFLVDYEDTSVSSEHAAMLHCSWLNDAMRQVGSADGWMVQTYARRSLPAALGLPSYIVNDYDRVLKESHLEVAELGRIKTTHLVAATFIPPASTASKFAMIEKAIFTGKSPIDSSLERLIEKANKGFAAYADSVRHVAKVRRLGLHPKDSSRNEMLEQIFALLFDEEQELRVGDDYPIAIGELLAARDIDPAGRCPQIGGKHMRVLSVLGPRRTHPGMLDTFMKVPATGCYFATRAISREVDQVTKALNTVRNAWSARKIKLLNKTVPGAMEGARVDQHAALKETAADKALLEAHSQSVSFFRFNSKVVLFDEDLERLTETIRTVKNALQGAPGLPVNLEAHNTLEAYFGAAPFARYLDAREGLVHSSHISRLYPSMSSWPGRESWACKQCGPEHARPAMQGITETGQDCYFDPHDDEDSQSAIIIGVPGSAKTTDVNALAAGYLRSPGHQFFGLDDKGRGMLVACKFLGGDYREDVQHSLFDDCDEDGFEWREKFLAMLGAVNDVPVAPAHRSVIKHALELLYGHSSAKNRSLSTFTGLLRTSFGKKDVEGQALCDALDLYTSDGAYRGIFDGIGSHVGSNPYEVHRLGDFLGAKKNAAVAGPLTLWTLDYFRRRFPGKTSFLAIDEAWKTLESEVAAALLNDFLRTLRAQHAGLGLITQSLGDVLKSAIGEIVLDACKVRVLYPNSNATTGALKAYQQLALTPEQIKAISKGRAKRDCSLQVNGKFVSFRYLYSPAELAVFGCTGAEEISRACARMIEHPDTWREEHMLAYGCTKEAARLRSLRLAHNGNSHTIMEAVYA